MSINNDKRSTFYINNTLSGILQGLIGVYTIIDLRNESAVSGKIVCCDGYMNVEMRDCIFKNSRDEDTPFDYFFIRARNIRYVHVPKNYSAVTLLEKVQIKSEQKQQKQKPTYKIKRAKQNHHATLKELKDESPGTSSES